MDAGSFCLSMNSCPVIALQFSAFYHPNSMEQNTYGEEGPTQWQALATIGNVEVIFCERITCLDSDDYLGFLQ